LAGPEVLIGGADKSVIPAHPVGNQVIHPRILKSRITISQIISIYRVKIQGDSRNLPENRRTTITGKVRLTVEFTILFSMNDLIVEDYIFLMGRIPIKGYTAV